ncbi:unnamed protein product, partial [Chrysoparadoxa australica]
ICMKKNNIKIKHHKGRIQKSYCRRKHIDKGVIGLISLDSGFIKETQLEACRKLIQRKVKPKGKLWICVKPNYNLTSTPVGKRIGKGKGSVDHAVYRVRPGSVILEIDGVSIELCRQVLLGASTRLPLKTSLTYREIIIC